MPTWVWLRRRRADGSGNEREGDACDERDDAGSGEAFAGGRAAPAGGGRGLQHDPMQKLILDRDPEHGQDPASQPTLSRFENRMTRREVFAMGVALAERVIERHRARRRGRAKRITVDLDGTDAPTHGARQGALFNGFYGGHCYLPLVACMQFDAETEQSVLTGLLRKGNAHAARGAIPLLKRLLPRFRAAFPKARLRVRLNGGLATPEIFDFLDSCEHGLVGEVGSCGAAC